MLDQNIKKELSQIFKKLDKKLEIELSKDSSHEDYSKLLDLFGDLEKISDQIQVKKTFDSSIPSFKIKNIEYKGLPLGHEFNTLLILILNSQGIGKLPDENTVSRIKSLPKMNIDSYISLSCENCPRVMQSLNLISLINPKVNHVIKDGQYFQEEINSLKIKGVPSVLINNENFISGKIDFSKILEKLEEKFKIEKKEQFLGDYDVAVIGGGPAGVSAAIYSARKGLKTCIISENIGGQLNDTNGIENLISNPYIEGKDLSERLRNHLKEYKIDLLENRKVESLDDNIILNTKEIIKAKAKIIATGASWRKLNVKGEKEFLGKGIHFCPNCDGPFYKNKDVVVVGGGNSGIEAAIDLSNIVKNITVLEYGDKIIADKVLQDKANSIENIQIIKNANTIEIKGKEKLEQIVYIDRKSKEEKILKTDAVFIQIGLSPNTQFLKNIELNSNKEIIINENNETSIKGVFAAGDVTNVAFKQIIISMGEGAKAALKAFQYIML